MGIAGNMAAENEKKEGLAKEYADVVLQIRQLEKQKDALKFKLDPMMKVGDRVGLVSKTEAEGVDIPPDSPILDEWVVKLGPTIVRRELNTKVFHALMESQPDLVSLVPKKKTTKLNVGS